MGKKYQNVTQLKMFSLGLNPLSESSYVFQQSLIDALSQMKQISTYEVDAYPYLTAGIVKTFGLNHIKLKKLSTYFPHNNEDIMRSAVHNLMQAKSLQTVESQHIRYNEDGVDSLHLVIKLNTLISSGLENLTEL
jgi:hypothetical protein